MMGEFDKFLDQLVFRLVCYVIVVCLCSMAYGIYRLITVFSLCS